MPVLTTITLQGKGQCHGKTAVDQQLSAVSVTEQGWAAEPSFTEKPHLHPRASALSWEKQLTKMFLTESK